MAAIRPFGALRYTPDVVGDLSRVIAPPYDVISEDEQERLYQASPYNIVRLTLGKQCSQDTEADNRYTRAQRDFEAWCQQGILQRDPQPALYLLEHTFVQDGQRRTRLGFLALLDFTDPIERAVYRHEATLAAPKTDRTKLLESVPANLEPIFCVYPDEGGALQARLQQLCARPPLADASLDEEQVRMWAVADPQDVAAIQRALASVAVLIADGHHRFEVALAHRDRYPAVMSYFVSMEDPALLLRGLPLRQVYAMASTGQMLPPKSTYFYPKVPSGLVIHSFEC